MEEELFKNQYRIKSARADWHDYNNGSFFITICTHNMVCCFGVIENDQMILNDLGRIANEYLGSINNHYPDVEVPLFVVMPNHIHAIFVIEDDQFSENQIAETREHTDLKMHAISQRRGLLSECVGKYKAAVTRYANKNDLPFKWQTRFHDHIIRHQIEGNIIANYIENNPVKWALDRFYKE
ncbi:MAG: transposase [Bacteroidales bacterium]